jgi:hypothetical protein
LRTHDSAEISVSGNDSPMSGKAMLTIVASTNAMNTPSEETASTVVGFGARRRIGSRSAAIRRPSR